MSRSPAETDYGGLAVARSPHRGERPNVTRRRGLGSPHQSPVRRECDLTGGGARSRPQSNPPLRLQDTSPPQAESRTRSIPLVGGSKRFLPAHRTSTRVPDRTTPRCDARPDRPHTWRTRAGPDVGSMSSSRRFLPPTWRSTGRTRRERDEVAIEDSPARFRSCPSAPDRRRTRPTPRIDARGRPRARHTGATPTLLQRTRARGLGSRGPGRCGELALRACGVRSSTPSTQRHLWPRSLRVPAESRSPSLQYVGRVLPARGDDIYPERGR